MNEFKKWSEIGVYDNELYAKRRTIIKKSISDFYEKIKNHSNILSSIEVYNLCDKSSFFNTIWSFKRPFNERLHPNIRTNSPVLFGLKTGIVFSTNGSIYFLYGKNHDDYFEINLEYGHDDKLKIDGNKIYNSDNANKNINSNQDDILVLIDFLKFFKEIKNNFEIEIKKNVTEENQLLEIKKERLTVTKQKELSNFDKDSDGKIDLIENGFNKLLSQSQKSIISVDKNYIHQFVKVSNYIKNKQQNTQKIFESIIETNSHEELEEMIGMLKNQIHSYELLVFHSINMVGSLVSEDFITFYEIYESFDKLGMFNSNWENEVTEKLSSIGSKLDDLMYSIYNMEQNIISELSHLSYVSQKSFKELNISISTQLKEVESSVNTNNLLASIQAYQLYKINKNTKFFRS
jgi:hypothetical protein